MKKVIKRKYTKGFGMASYIIIILGIIMTIGIFAAKNNVDQSSVNTSLYPSIVFPTLDPQNPLPSGINTSNSTSQSISCINGVCHTCEDQTSSSCSITCNNEQCTCSTGACIQISPPQTTP